VDRLLRTGTQLLEAGVEQAHLPVCGQRIPAQVEMLIFPKI
jgi:hypothetical protein